jgi:hypothetical protein
MLIIRQSSIPGRVAAVRQTLNQAKIMGNSFAAAIKVAALKSGFEEFAREMKRDLKDERD